ncbi:Leukocyte immunoglobulin-like receptor subfamily B member 4 [Myotis davidii]|nr:Leukocyte immunoglobulin-like receptor subfamily B member 4 [Myotis davidii]
MIPLGSSVTIWCQGTPKVEVYRLYKEGNAASWYQQKTLDPGDRAKFSITHMTKPDAGRYRCSFRSPSGWSGRSDPLELVVTGPLNILIGVSVALVLLLSILLFLLLRNRCQNKDRTSLSVLSHCLQQNRQDEGPQGVTYVQVNCSRPRPRQRMATSLSPLLGGLLDTKGRQAEEDRQMDSQVGPVLSRPPGFPQPQPRFIPLSPPAPGCCT